MNYLAIFCTSQYQVPQGGPCSPKNRSDNGKAKRFEKKHFRVAGCSVLDVVKQKSALKYTWFSTNI